MRLGLLVSPLTSAVRTRDLALAMHRYAPEGTEVHELLVSDVPSQPPYADQPIPPQALAWKHAISALDGLLILVTGDSRSIPGSVKAAIDWAARPAEVSVLRDLPCVVAAVGDGRTPWMLPLQHMRTVLEDAGARVMRRPDMTLRIDDNTFTDDHKVEDPEFAEDVVFVLTSALGFIAHELRVAEAAPLAAGPTETLPTRPAGDLSMGLETSGDAIEPDPTPAGK